MISVVIPSYNNWNLTHQCLFDVYQKFPNSEIIVTDDCSSSADVLTGLEWWKNGTLKDRLRVYTSEENQGFLLNAKKGVSKASGEFVVLLSNDVRVYDFGIEEKVIRTLKSDKPVLGGARLLDYDTGWNTFNGNTFPYLEGWLLAFRKKDWDMFGGFDERFAPYDFEDVDLSTTYISRGGKLVDMKVDVYHAGAQTIQYSEKRLLQTTRNQNKFEKKWLW